MRRAPSVRRAPRRRVPTPRQIRVTPERRRIWRNRQRDAWARFRGRDFRRERRTWRQRGGYRGYRIPSVVFRRHFGRRHRFRLFGLPFVVLGGYPRFQYAGYWCTILDPYPDWWGDYWYESDYCYIDYVNDGYYLFDSRFPGRPGIAISISLNL